MHIQRQKRYGLVVLALPLAFSVTACNRDVRLAGKKVESVHVEAVSHYGMTLDQDADPEQVAFIVLRAIREDMEAEDAKAREAALDIQLSLSAADALQSRNPTSLSRDEFVYGVVSRWTPTVSHYANDFETDWEKGKPRLHRREVTRLAKRPDGDTAGEECEVAMQVKSPDGDPNSSVVMLVWLTKDGGFWRVTHFGFDLSTRSLTGT